MSVMTRWLWVGVLFGFLLGGGLVSAQTGSSPSGSSPKSEGQSPNTGGTPAGTPTNPDKLSLEELISLALKENPDVKVAEAKLKEAEAEISRARMVVAQKMIAFHSSLVSARNQVADAEEKLTAILKLQEKKVVSQEEVKSAEVALAQKKSELARLEAELPYLLGQVRGQNYDWKRLVPSPGEGREAKPFTEWYDQLYDLKSHQSGASVDPAVADKIRKALNATITLKFQEKTLEEILDEFKGRMGVSFLDLLPREVKSQKLTLSLSEPVATGAALQALSDLTGLKFSVREYGILVTRGDLPAGAIPLHTFWKTPPATEKSKN
jgi:hypothetical protein